MPKGWLTERDPFSPVNYRYRVNQRIYLRSSGFQKIEVYETDFFGRILVLDGVVQATERDEFIYHEMLVHVPLHTRAAPKQVLVIGGGDGGAVREVLKHPSVSKVVSRVPSVLYRARPKSPLALSAAPATTTLSSDWRALAQLRSCSAVNEVVTFPPTP